MNRLFVTMLALITWAAAAGGAAAKPHADACPQPLLAMTYNIRLDTPADGENSWVHRRDLLIAQIQTLRPTVLGMQEVLPNQRADLEAALPNYAFIGGGRDDGKLAGEASPLAIDRKLFKIEAAGTFWLSPTPDVPSVGWDAAFRRVASWAHVRRKQDGARLLVINTHWDHIGDQARVQSGEQLAGWIKANLGARESLVLMGDFNTGVETPAIAQMIESAGIVPTAEGAGTLPESLAPSTFNAYDPLPAPGKVIDHIFVSKGIDIINAMVIAQHANGRVASDHFPVVALLGLPAKPGCPLRPAAASKANKDMTP